RARLQDELLALQARVHKTIVLVTHDIDEAIKLADYIAILNVGGVLEQFGPPADLLRSPANEFVASFLGRERALKRMALLRVRDVELTPGPVVEVDAPRAVALATMKEHRVDWIGLRDGDRLLGWVWGRALEDSTPLRDAAPEPFRAWVRPGTALREALDLIVDSSTRVAAVFDERDRYLGMLTIEQIADGMAKV
ncbi:MAG TPA: CBS domain-containing protein, partial [Acidimicrobiales bacterium]|nr:CBS domain-containing protein [Acidimicrobiales bacterium]